MKKSEKKSRKKINELCNGDKYNVIDRCMSIHAMKSKKVTFINN